MFDQTKISAEDYILLNRGILDIRDYIKSETASFVRQALLYLEMKESPGIILKISSQGGDVSPGLNIYDMLKDYRGRKTGKVICFADSIASIIVQACEVRQCLQHSTMLLHYITPNYYPDLQTLKNKNELQKLIKHLQERQDRINAIYLQRTKMDLAKLEKILKKGSHIKAEELLKLGLIDEIITNETD